MPVEDRRAAPGGARLKDDNVVGRGPQPGDKPGDVLGPRLVPISTEAPQELGTGGTGSPTALTTVQDSAPSGITNRWTRSWILPGGGTVSNMCSTLAQLWLRGKRAPENESPTRIGGQKSYFVDRQSGVKRMPLM